MESLNFCRAVASVITNFDYLGRQILENIMQMFRTWDATASLMPKGGETIWGDLNWCPEEWNNYDQVMKGYIKHFASNNTYESNNDSYVFSSAGNFKGW